MFGDFHDFCREATLPVCNLFMPSHDGTGYGGCELTGINLGNGQHLGNLGSVILSITAMIVTAFLCFRSEEREAAVGRREMQVFLLGYILVSFCEIFTVGGLPLSSNARIAFTGIHLGAVVATFWFLLLNAFTSYQVLDDGSKTSMSLLLVPGLALFLSTGYIALDTGYGWTGKFDSSLDGQNPNVELYILYQLVPLLFIVAYFIAEIFLVLKVLGEVSPIRHLILSAVNFALGQIFQYAIGARVCDNTKGKINGTLFETLFTLLSVVTLWIFWASITEKSFPSPPEMLELSSTPRASLSSRHWPAATPPAQRQSSLGDNPASPPAPAEYSPAPPPAQKDTPPSAHNPAPPGTAKSSPASNPRAREFSTYSTTYPRSSGHAQPAPSYDSGEDCRAAGTLPPLNQHDNRDDHVGNWGSHGGGYHSQSYYSRSGYGGGGGAVHGGGHGGDYGGGHGRGRGGGC